MTKVRFGPKKQPSIMTNILSDDNIYSDDATAEYVENIKVARNGVSIQTVMGPDIIRPLFVIVECYDHKKNGRVKRKWLEQFDERERKIVSAWYLKLYAYYLRTGIPIGGVPMLMSTLDVLRKAANFFATTR